MKNKLLCMLLLLITCIALYGCKVQKLSYVVEREPIETIFNEELLWGVSLNLNKVKAEELLGKASGRNGIFYEFVNENLQVGYENDVVSYLITSNPKFLDRNNIIKMNASIDSIINYYRNHDIYHFQLNEGDWYFMKEGGYNIVMLAIEGKVAEVAIINRDVSKFLKMMEENAELPNESELIQLSELLTFSSNAQANNELLQDDDFVQYLELGLIQNISVPLDLHYGELVRRFGTPSKIVPLDEQYRAAWYRRFNAHMIIDEKDFVKGIEIMISIPKQDAVDIFSSHGVELKERDNGYYIQYEDHKVDLLDSDADNVIDQLRISTNDY